MREESGLRVMFRTPGIVLLKGKAYPGFEWVRVDRDTYEELRSASKMVGACCGGVGMPFVIFGDDVDKED